MKAIRVLSVLGMPLLAAAGQTREYNLTLQATYMSKGASYGAYVVVVFGDITNDWQTATEGRI